MLLSHLSVEPAACLSLLLELLSTIVKARLVCARFEISLETASMPIPFSFRIHPKSGKLFGGNRTILYNSRVFGFSVYTAEPRPTHRPTSVPEGSPWSRNWFAAPHHQNGRHRSRGNRCVGIRGQVEIHGFSRAIQLLPAWGQFHGAAAPLTERLPGAAPWDENTRQNHSLCGLRACAGVSRFFFEVYRILTYVDIINIL